MAKRRRPSVESHGACHALAIAKGDAMGERLLRPVRANALIGRQHLHRAPDLRAGRVGAEHAAESVRALLRQFEDEATRARTDGL